MDKFCVGDKIDWHDDCKDSLMAEEIGLGPFIVRRVENVQLCGSGHCQNISLQKEINGKLFAWVSFKKEWVEDRPGPPYMAVPPTFSNLSFKAILECGYCDKVKQNLSRFEAPSEKKVPICKECCEAIFGWTFKQLSEYNERYLRLKSYKG